MGKFIIKKTKTGIKFDIVDAADVVVADSEVYTAKKSCLNGIASVRKNGPIAAIEDQTVEEIVKQKCPKYEIYNDKAGDLRFRLKARNGEIIAASRNYASMKEVYEGIEVLKGDLDDTQAAKEVNEWVAPAAETKEEKKEEPKKAAKAPERKNNKKKAAKKPEAKKPAAKKTEAPKEEAKKAEPKAEEKAEARLVQPELKAEEKKAEEITRAAVHEPEEDTGLISPWVIWLLILLLLILLVMAFVQKQWVLFALVLLALCALLWWHFRKK